MTQDYSKSTSYIQKIIKSLIGSKLDYSMGYPSKVIKHNGNGTVDLVCFNTKINGSGGLSQIPIRVGLPGIEIEAGTIPNGVRCMVSFENADPSRPYVSSFDLNGNTSGLIVKVGLTETQFVALSNLVNENFNSLKDYLTSHTHPTGTGPSGPPIQPVPTPVDVAAQRLKTV